MKRKCGDIVKMAMIVAGMLLFGISVFSSCGDDEGGDSSDTDSDADGECGTLAAGDSDISGHPVLDGAFGALLAMQAHADAIRTELDESLNAIGAEWGVEGLDGMALEDKVASVKGEIAAHIDANVSGSVRVIFLAPECSSSIAAAQAAMLACEQGSGCDVGDACLENTAVACQGQCQGGCTGSCSGSCELPMTAGSCSGVCAGACETTDAGDCIGTCDGVCAGTCSCGEWSGETCGGICDGSCTGVCEQIGGGSCSGECTGTCAVEATASCEGECHGSCDAECSDACQGDVTPPSCSADGECEAAAECAIQSSLWARAEVACAGSIVDVCYDFAAGVDATAQAEFNAKMASLSVAMAPVIDRTGENRDMFDADACAEIGIESGFVVMLAAFEDLSAQFEAGELDDGIAPGKHECVAPALEEASAMMAEMTSSAVEVLQAELSLLSVLNLD
jgi:hypothetical protein